MGLSRSGGHQGGRIGIAVTIIAESEGYVRGEQRKREALDLSGRWECDVDIAAVIGDRNSGGLTRKSLRGNYFALKRIDGNDAAWVVG